MDRFCNNTELGMIPWSSFYRTPLTSEPTKKTTHLRQNIQINPFLITLLLLLTLATGIQDATTWPEYHVFTSNQTGNTVLLAVAALSVNPNLTLPTVSTVLSLSMFVLGALLQGQAGNLLRCGRRRWWLLLASTVQTSMVFAAAALQSCFPVAEGTAVGMAVISLLAFSSGAQVATVRGLGITEIPTAMATAAFVDLVVDRNILQGFYHNVTRNRRIGFLLTLILGSFIGAAIEKYAVRSGWIALVVSGAVKVEVTVLILAVKGDKEERLDDCYA